MTPASPSGRPGPRLTKSGRPGWAARCWPWQLSDAARDAYRDFLKTNTGRVLTRLLKAQDTEGVKALLALDVMDADAFAEGAALAAKADNAEAAALLADAEHKKRAAAPQKKRYDFDF